MTIDYSLLLEACLGKYVGYKTYVAKHLTDYRELGQQIERIQGMAKCYSRLYERFEKKYIGHPDPANNHWEEDDVIPLDSIFYNIIISYARCFDTAKNKEGKESRRHIKLNRHFLRNIDKTALSIHDEIMDIRDRFVAHAGVSQYENYELKIGLDSDGIVDVKPGSEYRALLNKLTVYENLEILLNEVLKEIDKKIVELYPKVEQERKILSERPLLFLNRLHSGIDISESDVK